MYICTNTQVTGVVLVLEYIADELTSVHTCMYKQTNDRRSTHKTSYMYMSNICAYAHTHTH